MTYERGRFQGEIVGEVAGDKVEVLAYHTRTDDGLKPTGGYQVYVYSIGPRGGVRTTYSTTDVERLRRQADDLHRIADKVERYMRDVTK